jgi:hypothetical protein
MQEKNKHTRNINPPLEEKRKTGLECNRRNEKENKIKYLLSWFAAYNKDTHTYTW